ncbi:MAG TPA: hypothetical protein PLN54_05285 [Flavobacteriales bacterium]|nr:hypothetical protein [Flavobacteriales bacterium]
MRKSLFSLVCVMVVGLLPVDLHAQDVLDAIARDVCPCLGDLSAPMGKDSLTMKLGVCMLQASMPHQKELKKKYGVDLARFDGESGEKLGGLIAVKLITSCPDFMPLAMRLAEDDAPPPVAPGPAVRTVHGSVQEVTPSQFLTITVRTEDGRTYDLLLLDHVPNVEQVSQDPAKARGFHGKWGYEEREFFDPYTRSYRTYRVLRTLEP